MNAATSHFKQRNGSVKMELKLFPDYVEYFISGINTTGFSAKYEDLSDDFAYQTFRPNNRYIVLPLVLVAILLPFELLVRPQASALPTIGLAGVFGVVACGMAHVLGSLFHRDYTAIPTPSGKLLIVRDKKHDGIVRDLQARRAAALAKFAVIDPLTPPWQEVKKFRFLQDQGIISVDEFARYRAAILAVADAGRGSIRTGDTAPEARTLH